MLEATAKVPNVNIDQLQQRVLACQWSPEAPRLRSAWLQRGNRHNSRRGSGFRTSPSRSPHPPTPHNTTSQASRPMASKSMIDFREHTAMALVDEERAMRSATAQSFYSTTRFKLVPHKVVSEARSPYQSRASNTTYRVVPLLADRYKATPDTRQRCRLLESGVGDSVNSAGQVSEQRLRFMSGADLLEDSRVKKRTSEMLAHRIDRLYFLNGRAALVGGKYDNHEDIDPSAHIARNPGSYSPRQYKTAVTKATDVAYTAPSPTYSKLFITQPEYISPRYDVTSHHTQPKVEFSVKGHAQEAKNSGHMKDPSLDSRLPRTKPPEEGRGGRSPSKNTLIYVGVKDADLYVQSREFYHKHNKNARIQTNGKAIVERTSMEGKTRLAESGDLGPRHNSPCEDEDSTILAKHSIVVPASISGDASLDIEETLNTVTQRDPNAISVQPDNNTPTLMRENNDTSSADSPHNKKSNRVDAMRNNVIGETHVSVAPDHQNTASCSPIIEEADRQLTGTSDHLTSEIDTWNPTVSQNANDEKQHIPIGKRQPTDTSSSAAAAKQTLAERHTNNPSRSEVHPVVNAGRPPILDSADCKGDLVFDNDSIPSINPTNIKQIGEPKDLSLKSITNKTSTDSTNITADVNEKHSSHGSTGKVVDIKSTYLDMVLGNVAMDDGGQHFNGLAANVANNCDSNEQNVAINDVKQHNPGAPGDAKTIVRRSTEERYDFVHHNKQVGSPHSTKNDNKTALVVNNSSNVENGGVQKTFMSKKNDQDETEYSDDSDDDMSDEEAIRLLQSGEITLEFDRSEFGNGIRYNCGLENDVDALRSFRRATEPLVIVGQNHESFPLKANISERQRVAFLRIFNDLDENRDGVVTLAELKKGIFKKLKKPDVPHFFRVFDINDSQSIDATEFVAVAALNDSLLNQETTDSDSTWNVDLQKLSYYITVYKEMFYVFDSDRSGSISRKELETIIISCLGGRQDMYSATIKEILDTVDRDFSGDIEFVEYLMYIPFFICLHNYLLKKPMLVEDIEKSRELVKAGRQRK